MRDPQDDVDAEALIDELVARVEQRWHDRGERSENGWAVHALLHHKWAYLGGRLTTWTTRDLAELLTEVFPRKVVTDPGDADAIIAGSHELLHVLEDEELLTVGSDRPEALHRALEELAPSLDTNLADRRRFGPGKAMFTAMRDEGVNIEDMDAVAAWQQEFNRRPFAERDRILGTGAPDTTVHLGADRGPAAVGGTLGTVRGRGLDPTSVPPLELAPREQLASEVLAAPMVRQLQGLVTYVGQRLQLTDRGNLRLADGRRLVTELATGDRVDEWIGQRQFKTSSTTELPRLDFLFRVAVEAGLLDHHGRRLTRGEVAPLLWEEPLEAFEHVMAAVIEVGPATHRVGEDRYGFGWYAEDLDAAVPNWLVGLHVTGDRLPIDLLVDTAWNELLSVFELPDLEPWRLNLERRSVARSVRGILSVLERLGVVATAGVTHIADPDGLGLDQEVSGDAELTDLGRHLLHRLVAPFGEIPAVGALQDLPAKDLLEELADASPATLDAELEVWWRRHPDDGVAAVVDALPTVGPAALAVGWRLLWQMGDDAAAQAMSVDEPRSAAHRRAYQLLRDDVGAVTTPAETLAVLGAALDLVDEVTGCELLDRLAPVDPAAHLDAMWRVDDDRVEQVLETLARSHPRKPVTKAARKSLFKLRSAR